jgi:hypothetical protein
MQKLFYILSVVSVLLPGSGCKKQIQEENHSNLTIDFFSTAQGVSNGLLAAYAGLRNLYGPEEGIEVFTNLGCDEMRLANGNRTTNAVTYNSSFNSSNEFSSWLWNNSYIYINTCNGLVDYGSKVTGITDAVKKELIAEAKFLRAFYYFHLVQQFGGVTLNKNFSTTPTTSASRASLSDCYDFIVSDLQAAVTDLNPSPQQNGVEPGRATMAAAKHLLAKVYLQRASTGAAHGDDNQNAFNTAKDLIDNSASYGLGLLPNFGDVFKAGNEANKEVLFSVQYSKDLTYGTGGDGGNVWNHPYVCPYDAYLGQRNLADGRSYAWFRGTSWMYNVAFADKVNDSRYYKTFQSVWYATLPIAPKTGATTYSVKVSGTTYAVPVPTVKVGDTALYFPGFNMSIDEIKKRNYYVFTPENYTDTRIYPTMTKYLDPINRTTVNENSHRPIIVLRLGETYLVAAEAALRLGLPATAASYINTIRTRAATAGNTANMQISAGDVTIDFILDERTRELACEQVRWYDLVRTHKLVERVRKYDDYLAKPNIQDLDTLRPIPLSQINAVITGAPYPQNPGW